MKRILAREQHVPHQCDYIVVVNYIILIQIAVSCQWTFPRAKNCSMVRNFCTSGTLVPPFQVLAAAKKDHTEWCWTFLCKHPTFGMLRPPGVVFAVKGGAEFSQRGSLGFSHTSRHIELPLYHALFCLIWYALIQDNFEFILITLLAQKSVQFHP